MPRIFLPIDGRPYFSVSQVAELLGISIPGVHVWIQKGKIRDPLRTSRKGSYRIPRSEVVRLLKEAGREVPGLWDRPRTKLLLIDDDGLIRALVRKAFQDGSTQVKTAATPEDGLLIAAEFRPDVILLDSFHPRGGLASDKVLKILRRSKALKGARVVCVSSGGKVPGADAVLVKPFGIEELRGVVRVPKRGRASFSRTPVNKK